VPTVVGGTTSKETWKLGVTVRKIFMVKFPEVLLKEFMGLFQQQVRFSLENIE
jgi:hypothetical protein